jgi:hypothetical protein
VAIECFEPGRGLVTYLSSREYDLREKRRAMAEREQWAADEAQRQRWYDGIEAGDPRAIDALGRHIAAAHGTRIIYARNIQGASAFFWERSKGQKEIWWPPVTDPGLTREQIDQRAAWIFHELAHSMAEPCTGPDHYSDPLNRQHRVCLRCEELGWSIALMLSPFTSGMFKELQRCQKYYLESAPGSPEAHERIARQINSEAEARQRWQQHRRRMQRQLRVTQEVVRDWKATHGTR